MDPTDGGGRPAWPISVLVLDPQTLFRTGMARLLGEDDRLIVVGVSDGGDDVPERCAAQSIDVVLTDIEIRQWSAVALTRTIAAVSPDTRGSPASTVDWRVFPAMASGAAGFLVKDTEPEALRSAVLSAHLGEQVLCREAARWLLQDKPDYRLTRPEHDVLGLMAEGAGNSEIADSLRLGDKTVRNYVSRLYRKLAVHDRAEITSLGLHTQAAAGQHREARP